MVDLRLENLADTKAACESLGANVKPYACDVTDGPGVVSVFESIRRDMGTIECVVQTQFIPDLSLSPSHSVLVNNAGKSPGRPMHMETFDQFWKTIEVNFKGVSAKSSTISWISDIGAGHAMHLPGATRDA